MTRGTLSTSTVVVSTDANGAEFVVKLAGVSEFGSATTMGSKVGRGFLYLDAIRSIMDSSVGILG